MAVRNVAQNLRQNGFGVLPLHPVKQRVLRTAVEEFGKTACFRFPPLDAPAPGAAHVFETSYKECFRVLYREGLHVLCGLVRDANDNMTVHPTLPCPSEILAAASIDPFPTHASVPFEGRRHQSLFSGTFFNMFNYQHGSLNTHCDRCLITLVWGHHPANYCNDTTGVSSPHSRLWVNPTTCVAEVTSAREDVDPLIRSRSPKLATNADTDIWVDVQSIAGTGLVVFAGEQMSEATGNYFGAAEHTVRVDPSDKSWLSRSNEMRDPVASSFGNRLSVAMVISR